MKKLSVIVPMFKVEPFVERCVRSLEEQDIPMEEYEIICIDDGSPDRSGEIIEELQNEFRNIMLIKQENQGVSRARNNGIERAKGKYLLFIDPDDYVDAKSFARILGNADRSNAEVSFLGFTFLDARGQVRNQVFNENLANDVFQGRDAYYKARGDGQTDPDRMWAVLFRTDFFNKYHLRYLPDVPFLEDGEFIARILTLAQRCVFDGHSFYQRTTRPGSATNSKLAGTHAATNGFILAINHLKQFREEYKLDEDQRIFLNQPIAKFVLLAIQSSAGQGKGSRLVHTIRTLKLNHHGHLDLRGCHGIYRLYGLSYNLSPYIAAIMLFLYPKAVRLRRIFRVKSLSK